MDDLLALFMSGDGGGGGTSNYEQLSNLPKINNIELKGNKTAADLGLATPSDIPSDVVKTSPQTLTDEQKKQARANIGADPVVLDVIPDQNYQFADIKLNGVFLNNDDIIALATGGQTLLAEVATGTSHNYKMRFFVTAAADNGVEFCGLVGSPVDGKLAVCKAVTSQNTSTGRAMATLQFITIEN